SSLSPSARITPSDLSLKFFGIPSVRKTTTSPAGGYHVPGHLHFLFNKRNRSLLWLSKKLYGNFRFKDAFNPDKGW
ncbi:MAG: hypothetical protein WC331_09280, partial [Candidatus Omnitrophota bacterium]